MSDGRETAETPLDVGVILEALRVEVRSRRLAQGRAEPSPAERDLQRALDEIELYRVISAHWPLLGTTLPQRVVALCNKLVRRYLRWYINPIVEQQNAYNDAVARTLRLLAEAYAELGQQGDESREPSENKEQRTKNKGAGTENQAPGSVGEGDGPRATDYGQLMSLVRA